MSTSTPNARGRRSPFGTATPSGETTLTGVSATHHHLRDYKLITLLSPYSFNAFLSIPDTLLRQVDLSPQPPQAPNGPPLDIHHVLEAWVLQQRHM